MMGTQPEYIGKRMRELLEGAAIGFIPKPIDKKLWGTIDEETWSLGRFLFLGYEQEDSSDLLWSVYCFYPNCGIFTYETQKTIVRKYYDLCKNGEIPTDVFIENRNLINDANDIPCRGNGFSYFFLEKDQVSIEQQLKPIMKINPELSQRDSIKEFMDACKVEIGQSKQNELNIWGDYDLLWNDCAFFFEYRYECTWAKIKRDKYIIFGEYFSMIKDIFKKKPVE